MKSRHYPDKNKLFFYSAFFIMTLVMIYPLFTTGIACSDDLQNYMIARWGNYMQNAAESAAIAGRFYYYLVKPLNILPYLIDNIFVVKLFQVIPLVICFLLFARVVYVLTRSLELSFLFYLFFLVFSQVSGYTSLFVTYPFYYTFSFSLLLCSFLLLLSYIGNRDRKALFFSALLYAVGLLFYETYLFYLIVFVLTIFLLQDYGSRSLKERIGSTFRIFLPFMIIAVAYLVVYLVFRRFNPSNYGGTEFDPGVLNFKTFFGVLWSLSTSAFPLTVYESSRELFFEQSGLTTGYSPVVMDLIINAKVEWIIKGILAAIAGYLLFTRLPVIRLRTLLTVIVLSVLLIFMPHIPLAMTPKYTFYVELGMSGYVTTFFSLFGVLLFLIFLTGYIIQISSVHRYLRMAVTVAFAGLLFVFSVITDFSNDGITTDIRRANLKFRAMDEMIRANVFYPIPGKAVIFGKDLYENPYHSAQNLVIPPFTWETYINIRTGYWFENFLRNEDDYSAGWKKNPENIWYFRMIQGVKSDDIAVVIAKLSPPENGDSTLRYVSDSAWVLYYSPYKIFSAGFLIIPEALGSYQPIRVETFRDTLWKRQGTEVTVFNIVREDPATFFSIYAESIDLKSIRLSNLVSRESNVVYLNKQSRYGYREK